MWSPLTVAYAGFSKGGARKFENNENQKKNFSTQNQSVFLPNLGEDQKKRSSLNISPVFGPKLREDQR